MIDRLSCGPITYPSVGAVAGCSAFGCPPSASGFGMSKSGLYGAAGAGGCGFGFAGVCAGDGVCDVCAAIAPLVITVSARARRSGFLRMIVVPLLLGDPDERDAELSGLPVQIGTLNTKSLGGGSHPPLVMLENGRDVVALETLPGLAQIARGNERRARAVELQDREDVLDLNDVFDGAGDHAFDGRAQLGEIPGPGQCTEQRERGLRRSEEH